MTDVNWGILGTGRAARGFARGLASAPGSRLVAVGSRSQERATAFARRFRGRAAQAPKAHSCYAALTGDNAVDVVYVATPHSRHCGDTLLCLEAGRAVLCEKPLALNGTEAEAMIRRARERNLFLMEAMWSHFLPAYVKLGRLLEESALGLPRLVRAECCWRSPRDPKHRLFDPDLGGGALLDLGVYGVSLAAMVFGGPPETVSGKAWIGETGVDEHGAAVLGWPDGGVAVVACSIRAQAENDALVAGSAGTVGLEGPFWRSAGLVLEREGETGRRMAARYKAPGYQHVASEVTRCLREGLRESPRYPAGRSLEVVRTMDRIRHSWGLTYPEERRIGGSRP